MKLSKDITKRTKAEIQIIPWLKQVELLSYYQQASLFLFPSFEGQGLVVAEALANSCPILCLENTGPAFLAGEAAITVKTKKIDETVILLSNKLNDLFNEYSDEPQIYEDRIEKALTRAHELTWEKKTAFLMEIYNG